MPDPVHRRICLTARLLGYAGLLPQAGAVATVGIVHGMTDPVAGAGYASLAYLLGLGYALAILNFLGGIWWGFAMRRTSGQAPLAIVAVVPTLIGMAILAVVLRSAQGNWAIVALGAILMLTLLIDRRLAAGGEAPGGWMAFRTPLSLGLGALTAVLGIMGLAWG